MRAPDFWREPPGLVSSLLAPVGAAFDAAGRLRRAVVRPYRAPVPVGCVGNLVAGGSGKTPVVLALATLLAARGIGTHVVMRGYRGRLSGPVRVDPALHDAAAVGDEALLAAAVAPCWVARDRAAGVRAAVDAGAAAILLDDGFQNPAVAKDVALVVVDAEYGFGNRRLIPAGPLRERVEAGLARADFIVLLDGEAGHEPEGLAGIDRPIQHATLAPVGGERFAGERVVAFAGIGRPAKFFASLRRLGATPVAERAFPDHHPFRESEIAALRHTAEQDAAILVTTAKDWVRLRPGWRPGIEILEIELQWRDSSALMIALAPFLSRHGGHGLPARPSGSSVK